ncbi:Endoribonuclease YBEY [Seminavis robusta]|uniref:Endoribonuclease YBEY n=1 Tax=Seminavis robusta TaxID=568900 RepID=A0A9N8HIE4_9STRA|nr:Endoribonuclease YBEY [Seminavis robusta]|eukprot:Sro495_g154440.1 Endoribonuclease YBEY (251) ;mRNA; r:23722-24474
MLPQTSFHISRIPSLILRSATTIRMPSNYCGRGSLLYSSSTRLLGSKAGVPGNPPGEIVLEDYQEALPNIDQDRLKRTVEQIREILGYTTYDLSLYLVEDELMQETNLETRGMNKPTDILSFPFHEPIEPGRLQEPEFQNIPDYFSLGEMMIDVPYVIRGCQEDSEFDNQQQDSDLVYDDNNSEEDRGVSGAMATVYDPEERIHMLLVHGMLHLVGHDHEQDDEYELMVQKEEEILIQLGMMDPAKGNQR